MILASSAILTLVWTHHSLGRFWTARLRISSNHELIQYGPYKYLRHPMYYALFLFYISIALMSGNTIIIALSVISGCVLLLRIPAEEAMLIEHFGDAYYKYIQETGGLAHLINYIMWTRDADRVKLRSTPRWYKLLRGLGRPLLRSLWDIHVEGEEHIPEACGFVLVANHSSWADTILIGYAFSDIIYYLTDSEWYFRWYMRPIVRIFAAIPIYKGKTTRSAVQQCVQKLREGKIVGVFPEGRLTRDGNLQKAASGAGFIAKIAKTPILPVAILGAYYAYPYHRRFPRCCTIKIRIGKAIWPDNQDYRELTAKAMTKISRMLHR